MFTSEADGKGDVLKVKLIEKLKHRQQFSRTIVAVFCIESKDETIKFFILSFHTTLKKPKKMLNSRHFFGLDEVMIRPTNRISKIKDISIL
jgi:hypothetical protein